MQMRWWLTHQKTAQTVFWLSVSQHSELALRFFHLGRCLAAVSGLFWRCPLHFNLGGFESESDYNFIFDCVGGVI
jgi:hypothetical protein